MKKFFITLILAICFSMFTNAAVKVADFSFNRAYNVKSVLVFDNVLKIKPRVDPNIIDIIDLTVDSQLEINYVYIGELDDEVYSLCTVRVRNNVVDGCWVLGLLQNVKIVFDDNKSFIILDKDNDVRLLYYESEDESENKLDSRSVALYSNSFDIYPQFANSTMVQKITKAKPKTKSKSKHTKKRK